MHLRASALALPASSTQALPGIVRLALPAALAFHCLLAFAAPNKPDEPASPAAQAAVPTAAPGQAAPRKNVRYIWRINAGDKVSDAFRAWARQSRKWQVVWEAPELIAEAGVDLDGSFEDAVTRVIEALNRGNANLLARLYVDSSNSVLRVMEKK